MFNNIGSKIKTLATVLCILGIITSCIWGIVLLMDGPIGLLVAAGGSLASWLGSFFAYGFGQLIENTDILAGRQPKPADAQNPPSAKTATVTYEFDDEGNLVEGNLGKSDLIDIRLVIDCARNIAYSKYDLSLQWNGNSLGVLPHGEYKEYNLSVPAGEYTLTAHSTEDETVMGQLVLQIDKPGNLSVMCDCYSDAVRLSLQ